MTTDDDAPALLNLLLPLAEAASRLGLHPAALRSRIRRGVVTAKRGNDRRLLVEVPANARPGHDLAMASPDEDLAAEVDHLREQLTLASVAAGRAEERARTLRELADRLTAELADARRELVEVRRPWWSRLIGPR